MSRRNWQRNELLLALNLYCKLPFGQYHERNPQIIDLASFIGRSPGAVAMKLSNFASFDPYHKERGVVGLANSGKADREVWDEFHNNWNALALESELAYEEFQKSSRALNLFQNEYIPRERQNTEIEREVRIRVGQNFFRTVIMTSYRQQCCICGLPISEMLIASHIIPWRDSEEHRLNPHNGLCLCALHDRGFDRGFLTIGENYEVLIGTALKEYLPNQAVTTYFEVHHGKQIQLPDKFVPMKEFLSIHRENYFKG